MRRVDTVRYKAAVPAAPAAHFSAHRSGVRAPGTVGSPLNRASRRDIC